MEYSGAIETIGSITKMEYICSLEQNILPNTMVLQNVDPFPGYRIPKSEESYEHKTESIFIILGYKYSPEKINRINKKLITSRISEKAPSYGEIITRDSILPCIRIKGLEHFEQISLIQNFFLKNEFQLMPFRIIESKARIKIFKTFRLIEIGEGLYRDLSDGAKIYIRITKLLSWNIFEEITKKIKFDMNNRNFDAALGIIYRFCGPEDVIRIYDQEKTLERALQLKKCYLKEIKRARSISVHHDYFNE
jgi:hypothetical protein